MKKKHYFWGILLILFGVGLAGNEFDLWDFNLSFEGWWTLFIIVPCLFSVVQNGPSLWNILGALLGVALLLSSQNMIDPELIGKLIFPVLLIGAGASLLLRRDWLKPKESFHTEIPNESTPEYNAMFSGQEEHFTRKQFYGARLNSLFGGIDLNLKEAIIDQDVLISASVVFGGVTIITPSNVKIQVSGTPIFGGISNKATSSADPNAPTLYINGTCIFGGIDIL